TWTFSRGQEYMFWNNVETKPFGGYPHNWDAKLLNMLEQANPGGQKWRAVDHTHEAPYGRFDGETSFEAVQNHYDKQGPKRALGYLPTDDEWNAPNRHEETATGELGLHGDWGGSAQLPEHRVWYFYLQRLCNHCTYPGCLAACPRG